MHYLSFALFSAMAVNIPQQSIPQSGWKGKHKSITWETLAIWANLHVAGQNSRSFCLFLTNTFLEVIKEVHANQVNQINHFLVPLHRFWSFRHITIVFQTRLL